MSTLSGTRTLASTSYVALTSSNAGKEGTHIEWHFKQVPNGRILLTWAEAQMLFEERQPPVDEDTDLFYALAELYGAHT